MQSQDGNLKQYKGNGKTASPLVQVENAIPIQNFKEINEEHRVLTNTSCQTIPSQLPDTLEKMKEQQSHRQLHVEKDDQCLSRGEDVDVTRGLAIVPHQQLTVMSHYAQSQGQQMQFLQDSKLDSIDSDVEEKWEHSEELENSEEDHSEEMDSYFNLHEEEPPLPLPQEATAATPKLLGHSIPEGTSAHSFAKIAAQTHIIEDDEVALLTSPIAKRLWTHFSSSAGFSIPDWRLKQVLHWWWDQQPCVTMKPILYAIPSFIIWQLWRRRNTIRHGGTMSYTNMIFEITNNARKLIQARCPDLKNLPSSWPDLVQVLSSSLPKIDYKAVSWFPPPIGYYKCNTDGASRGNPGPSALGFCLSNPDGDLLYACAKLIDEGTNVLAEALAILEAVSYCRSNSLVPTVIETDSMLLKNAIVGIWKPPWSVATIVDEIRELNGDGKFSFIHVYREGNQLADYLANYAFEVGNTVFHSFTAVPTKGRNIINLDKVQRPAIRARIRTI